MRALDAERGIRGRRERDIACDKSAKHALAQAGTGMVEGESNRGPRSLPSDQQLGLDASIESTATTRLIAEYFG